MSRLVGRRSTALLSVVVLVTSLFGGPAFVAAADPAVRSPVGQLTPATLDATSGGPVTRAPHALPFLSIDPGALRGARIRAAAAASIGQHRPLSGEPQAPLTGLFNGTNKGGLLDHTVAPPDSTGAIGPTQYIEMVNQQVGVYDRSLNLLSSTDNATFMAASGWQVSDPQIQWDPQGNRWLYAGIGIKAGDNVLLFGWSKTSLGAALTTGWCRFGIGRGKLLDDYPKLGHDDNFILIGSNVYDDTVPNYGWVTADLWAIPKPPLGDTSCTGPSTAFHFADATHVLHNQDGSEAFTPVPANTADASEVGYVLAAHTPLADPIGPQTQLMLWHVVSDAGTPNLVSDGEVTVPSFDVPAPAPQVGSTYHLDTLDARLTQAVAHADPGAGGAEGIWTQHTVAGPGGRSVVRWYEILPGSPPQLHQQGQLESATDWVFNAAISPAGTGEGAAIFYNRAGPGQLPLIGALVRGPATPLGQMDPGELVIWTSPYVDTDFTCSNTTPCRWGDYAGASPDPVNANVVWGSNQFTGACYVLCGLFAQWRTRNFAVEVPTGAPPVPTPPTAPQSLSANAANGSVNLAWLAPSSDGGAAISGYEVWRGTDPTAKALVASPGNVLSYADSGLVNGETYYYVVRAVNSAGPGPDSNQVSATPLAVPSAPQNLVATNASKGGIRLNWTASLDAGGSPITNYLVYRGLAPGTETLYATLGNVLTYRDASATNHHLRYYYVIRAVNAAGTSPPSNEVNRLGH